MSWVEVDGAGWSWVEVVARFSNTHFKYHQYYVLEKPGVLEKLRGAVSCVKIKAISHFAVKLIERNGHLFSVYSMNNFV